MNAGADVTADLKFWRPRFDHQLLVRVQARKMLRGNKRDLSCEVIIAGLLWTDDRLACSLRGMGGMAAEW